jgi:hypothetical protein
MFPNVSLAEGLGVAGIITPATTANTQRVTGAIDMSKWDQLLFVFQLGDMASETIDCGVETCDSDGTSNTADITGRQATQLAASASANDGKQILITVRSADLIANGKQYVRGTMVTGGATGGPAACVVLGLPHYGPADGVDIASVVQVIK